LQRVEIWDGWRGIAISFLLLGHFINLEWIWEDRLGVDIFFVLSGMLMSKILFEKRMNLKDFYIRRFSRIFPVLFLFVIVLYIFEALVNHPFLIREIFANLTFIRTYYPSEPHIWDASTATGHLWSLNVEEHAYVIMSVLTLVFFRTKYAAFALLLLGFLSIAICFYNQLNLEPRTGEFLSPRFRIRTECAVSFIFISAGYYLLKNKYKFVVHPFIPGVTFLAAISCYVHVFPEWLSFSLAPILLAFTVNHLLEAAGIFRFILTLKAVQFLGIWSYSIYLWQQPFYEYSYKLPGGAISGLILSILVGLMSYYIYENPVRSWINNRYSKKALSL